MSLRPYQAAMVSDVKNAWACGHKNTLIALPTGAGKTRILAYIVADHGRPSCVIAHRQELVGQISMALSFYNVPHKIIAPPSVIKFVCRLQMDAYGRTFYDPNAMIAVASVNTLIRRKKILARWADSVTLWIQDESHHVLKKNVWGKAAELFPHAYGLGVTATPCRADGKGLGRDNDGLFDKLIVGPSMREIIDAGYLTDYRIFLPKTHGLDLTTVEVSNNTGEYKQQQLKKTVRKSQIVGDVVDSYLRFARGKLGVTFVTDVDTAFDISNEYRANGVPSEVVSHKTPDNVREQILRRFKRREILQLTNVDLFGEGFDLPAIEVVSMARPTMSYPLYIQQFGRGLRILDGKQHAIIIDHVGNVLKHGLPDTPRQWTLERRDKRASNADNQTILVTACPQCTAAYRRHLSACPYCGHVPVPTVRSGPEFVDGDLIELDSHTLAKLRRGKDDIDRPVADVRAALQAKHCPDIGVHAHAKRHVENQETQKQLRNSICVWGACKRREGLLDRESYRLFYLRFGMDVLTACGLKSKDAQALDARIREDMA